MTFWDIWWDLWLLGLAADFLAKLTGAHNTLSEHVWERWAPARWQRVLVVAFGLQVFVFHFGSGGRLWLGSGWAVIVTSLPVAWLVGRVEIPAIREAGGMGWIKSMWSKVTGGLGHVVGWLATGKHWVLTHGPLWAVVATVLAQWLPGAAPLLHLAASAISNSTASTVSPDSVALIAEAITSATMALGAIRKLLTYWQPLLLLFQKLASDNP